MFYTSPHDKLSTNLHRLAILCFLYGEYCSLTVTKGLVSSAFKSDEHCSLYNRERLLVFLYMGTNKECPDKSVNH